MSCSDVKVSINVQWCCRLVVVGMSCIRHICESMPESFAMCSIDMKADESYGCCWRRQWVYGTDSTVSKSRSLHYNGRQLYACDSSLDQLNEQ